MSYKGKAIYQPSGKAAEYARWACNFFVGCSNGCTYCYCKKGLLAGAMGQDQPQLKKFGGGEIEAFSTFKVEVEKNLQELQKDGLFFSFSTDPMLEKCRDLTYSAISVCMELDIPVTILTKRMDWIDVIYDNFDPKRIAVGFTLTGHDELEPGASPNIERIRAMKHLHDLGFITWASIEPIIDFPSSKSMIEQALPYCDLFKVGLLAGGKYDQVEGQTFVEWLNELDTPAKFYLKETFQKLTHYTNEELDNQFVGKDYNLFTSITGKSSNLTKIEYERKLSNSRKRRQMRHRRMVHSSRNN